MRKCPPNRKLKCPKCGGEKYYTSKMCRKCANPGVPIEGRLLQLIVDIAKGKTIKEIALEWNRSSKTVEYYWSVTKAKYGFQSPINAALYAVATGMVNLKDLVNVKGAERMC